MAQQPTVTQASQSGLISITNRYTQKIEKIASLASLQVGMPDLPAKLQLFGDLILKSLNVTLDGGAQYTAPSNATFVNIAYSGTGAGSTTIILPKNPIIGQLVIIKDFSGDAATVNLIITADGVISIDGSTTATISANYGALQLFWNGTSWSSIGTNSAGGGGGSGDVVGPASATDNAVVRFNSTTGKLIQNSAVTIADITGDITTPGDIALNGGDITTTATTFNIVNSTATTVNFAGGATTALTIGNTASTNNTIQGRTSFPQGLSGSLTRLTDGTSYIAAGSNVTIASSSNGQIIVSSTGGGGTGADSAAQYVVMALTASLPNERALTAGTGLNLVDGGAGSTATFSINDSIVATVSGTTFTGVTKHNVGLSGSLTKLVDGTSYLIAGNNVTITTGSSGAVTISSTATGSSGGGGDSAAEYLVLSITSSLSNERVFIASTGLTAVDGGPNGGYTLSVNDSVVATVSGTTFKGTIQPYQNNLYDLGGPFNRWYNSYIDRMSGSLTKLTDGTSYLIAGSNITIATGSNGAVTISSTGGGGSPGGLDTYVQFNDGGSTFGGDSGLTYNKNTDTLTITGDLAVNGGDITTTATTFNIAGSNATTVQIAQGATNGVNLGNSAGRNFIAGYTEFNQGLSGSLTKLIDGTSYIRAGTNVTVTTASNGSITIDSSASGGAPTNASYLLVGGGSGAGQLSDERTFVASTGLTATDGGANGNYTVAINDSVVATVSGTTFTGVTKHNAGLSGSLTKLTDGTSYLIAGTGMSVTTGSTGAVNLSINDSVVATVSGTRFTGDISSAGNITAEIDLKSIFSSGDEGGQIFLSKSVTNTVLTGGVSIDVYQNRLRFFEQGGTARGYYVDISNGGAGASTNLVGGGSSPGGSDTYVQFNDGGSTFGGDSGLTYNKNTDTLTVTGDLDVNGGDITTTASTFNLLQSASTLNVGTTALTRTINIATPTANVQTVNVGNIVDGTKINMYASGTSGVGIKTHSGYTGSDMRTITGAVTTTDATTTTIAVISGSAGGPGTVYWVEGTFTAHNGTNSFGMAQRHACFYVNAAGNSMTQQGSTNNTISIGQFPTWTAALTTSGANILARVTGAGGTTIDWAVTLRYQAVSGSA